MVKALLELQLASTVVNNKKIRLFESMFTAKDGLKKTLVHYLMRLVTL